MQQYIEDFCSYLDSEMKRSSNTIAAYRRDLNQFAKFLADQGIKRTSPDKINKTAVMSYMLFMEKSGKTAATVARGIAAIKTFFKYLLNTGIIKTDPIYKVKTPHVNQKLPSCVDINSIEALLTQPESNDKKAIRDRAILELLFATGVKVSELIALKVSDINLAHKYVQCCYGSKRRTIPMGQKAVLALEDYLSDSRALLIKDEEETALFVNCKGGPFSRQGLWKIVKEYSKKAGLKDDITPNTLRQSFGVHLATNGADLKSLQEMLGHTGMSTTQAYFRAADSHLMDVYNRAHPRR